MQKALRVIVVHEKAYFQHILIATVSCRIYGDYRTSIDNEAHLDEKHFVE